MTMSALNHSIAALAQEARQALGALLDRRLALLLGLLAALLLAAAQAPLTYAVDVGVEDGPGSDLPLVAGFHPRERDIQGTFRWSRGRSQIRLPGVGARPLQLTLRFIAVSPEVAERGPREIELWANGALAARLPVRPAGAVYRLVLPPAPAGDYWLELRSATIVPTGDERAIGAGLNSFVAAAPGGPALPAARSTLGWLAAAALAWLAVRRVGFGPAGALAMLLPGALLAGLAALLDPPRFAFGAAPALVALALGWGLALLLCARPAALAAAGAALAALGVGAMLARAALGADGGAGWAAGLSGIGAGLLLGGAMRPAVARLVRRLGLEVPHGHWRWLALMAVLVLATRYGGKIYPDSMPGDIGFHANRFVDVVRGTVLIVSRNRGVDFPYPPAFYLLLMPFSLLGVDRRVALQLGGALLDALSPLLVYAVAASAVPRPGRAARSAVPLVAAAVYSFSAAGYMTTWWNFSTHIFAQFAHLLLVAALVVVWPALGRRAATGASRLSTLGVACGLVLLQCLVYLGHFGFWMNMSLLGAFGLLVLGWARYGPPRRAGAGRAFWTLLASFAGAQALAALLFYTGYTGMLLAQVQAAASGGLTGLAGRAPLDRAVLWQILWEYGLVTHFGFFALPLALCGGLLLWAAPPAREVHRPAPSARAAVLTLMAGTLAIAVFFAVLPFLSGSTLSSRWLMFSAWAVAVGAALGAHWLWRRGVASRVALGAAGCYVLWVTASMWLGALAWRIRPPEPF